jgi:hypothetical protein
MLIIPGDRVVGMLVGAVVWWLITVLGVLLAAWVVIRRRRRTLLAAPPAKRYTPRMWGAVVRFRRQAARSNGDV